MSDTKKKPTYVRCQESEIPIGIRWDTPRHNQGQMVEVSYGTFGRGEAGSGDPYKRIEDRTDRTVTYWRLVEGA